MNREEMKRIVKENNISYLRLQFTDMLGDIKVLIVWWQAIMPITCQE